MIEELICFPSFVYKIKNYDFLYSVNQVSEEFLNSQKQSQNIDSIYPVIMSGNYSEDSRITKFSEFILDTSYQILDRQGYTMKNLSMVFTEMWTQEHHKMSGMEQHVHGFGSQISGLYFLEVPEESSNLIFYDPRPGKVQINLPEKDIQLYSIASQMLNFKPEQGLIALFNSWLPHSFSRHTSDSPIKFVHFNLGVKLNNNLPDVEIV
ncbi:hypothetical protein EB118_22260 [bacterium]|nr:hypothetical protein [Betaproteobacteria bacterium]NDG32780.1 hypothetical protein [bacterium]